MDRVKCAIFLALITDVAETMTKKLLCMHGKKQNHHLKRVIDSETRSFLIPEFYRQALAGILIGNSPVS